MIDFTDLTNKIYELLEQDGELSVVVDGAKKIIAGAAQYVSVNSPDAPYIKIAFTDGSGLVLLLLEETIYFSPSHLGELATVTDDEIGVVSEILYNNERFALVNQHDYQFVTVLLYGDPVSIEGECQFSDYLNPDESKVLSLGWLSYTGERADVYAEVISPETIILPTIGSE